MNIQTDVVEIQYPTVKEVLTDARKLIAHKTTWRAPTHVNHPSMGFDQNGHEVKSHQDVHEAVQYTALGALCMVTRGVPDHLHIRAYRILGLHAWDIDAMGHEAVLAHYDQAIMVSK